MTSGGTAGWQELALFLIAQDGGARRAARAAKIWLMADRGEIPAPFASMIRATPQEDAPIRAAQIRSAENDAVFERFA